MEETVSAVVPSAVKWMQLTCASTDVQQRKKFMGNIHESSFIVPLSAVISSSVKTTLCVHLISNNFILSINIAFVIGSSQLHIFRKFHRQLSIGMQSKALHQIPRGFFMHTDPHRHESVTVSCLRLQQRMSPVRGSPDCREVASEEWASR